jgi:hypothetical protein
MPTVCEGEGVIVMGRRATLRRSARNRLKSTSTRARSYVQRTTASGASFTVVGASRIKGQTYFWCVFWRFPGAGPRAARLRRPSDFARPASLQVLDLLALFRANRHFRHEKDGHPVTSTDTASGTGFLRSTNGRFFSAADAHSGLLDARRASRAGMRISRPSAQHAPICGRPACSQSERT